MVGWLLASLVYSLAGWLVRCVHDWISYMVKYVAGWLLNSSAGDNAEWVAVCC